jgi:hypothetical protein
MPKICSSLVAPSTMAIRLALFLLCGSAAQAQSGASSRDDATKQLLDRVRELEAKVKQLEENEAAAASALPVAPAPARAAAPEPAPVVEQPQVNEVAPRLKLLLFGDTGYQIGHFFGPTSTFEFGEFDIFATARLTDRVSALAEVLFPSSSDNSIGVDIERLSLKTGKTITSAPPSDASMLLTKAAQILPAALRVPSCPARRRVRAPGRASRATCAQRPGRRGNWRGRRWPR